MIQRRSACHALVAVALVLGTRASTGAQSADVTTIELRIGDNMRFTPSVIEARPGQRLRVVLVPVGKIAALGHNFVVLRQGVTPKTFIDKAGPATKETGAIPAAMQDQVVAATVVVRPGQTAEATFEVPSQPGEYTFLCSFPGHFNLGMRGQLIVK